ncbi:unnamed protein product, partial [Polarella glacialis]
AAVVAAKAAAHAVAAAARLAAASRAKQRPAGVAAWDVAWQEESAPLLRSWREAAVNGSLLLAEAGCPSTPESEAASSAREAAIKAALDLAEERARAAGG